jgi:carbamoyl-phosphate synthase large subunit
LNAGSRNHLIRCFLKSWAEQGEIIVSDSYPLAPSLYEDCRSFIIPFYKHKNYTEAILDLCEKQKVTGVLSLIDPDLSILSELKTEFASAGILAFISEEWIVKATFDKWEMFKVFEANHIPTVKSWADLSEFLNDVKNGKAGYPIMVKPREGSGSRGLHYIESEETLISVWNNAIEPMLIQRWIEGRELGADLYFDIYSGELIEFFIKEKLKMRAGETDKSVSLRDEKAENLLKRLSRNLALYGPIDVDLFITAHDDYLISEINPRFGGGYPHAYACEADYPGLILQNMQGKHLTEQKIKWQSGHYMMKFFDMVFIDDKTRRNAGEEIKQQEEN